MPNRTPKYDKHDVRRALQKQGKTLTSIAKAAGRSESLCRMAFIQPSASGEAIIAAETGFPAHRIWPDRYQKAKNGTFSRIEGSKARALRKRKIAPQTITTEVCSNYERSGELT